MNCDNKYKATTSFATDEGRVKQELNVNRHDEATLKGAEKTEMMGALRFSNIKFDLDEKGADEFKERDRELDQQRLSARTRKLPMQPIGEVRESVEQRGASRRGRVFNAGKYSVADPSKADYESGALLRSRTGQRVRQEHSQAAAGPGRGASLSSDKATSPFSLKHVQSAGLRAGGSLKPSVKDKGGHGP